MGRQPAAPGRAALLPGILDQRPEAGQDALVVRQPRVAGRHRTRIDRGVGVPEEHRVVPELAGQEGDVREAGVERGAVEDRAVAVLVRPRVQARPRRPAGCGVGPVVGEEHASGGQRVQGRRLHDGVAEGREAVAPPLVQRDEQARCEPGACRHSCPSRAYGPRAIRPDGATAGRHGAHEVRTDVPPSLIPKSIIQAPTRGAHARRTARPPETGTPEAERCAAPCFVHRLLLRAGPRTGLPPGAGRHHQFVPVGICLGVHCVGLDHRVHLARPLPFSSLLRSPCLYILSNV